MIRRIDIEFTFESRTLHFFQMDAGEPFCLATEASLVLGYADAGQVAQNLRRWTEFVEGDAPFLGHHDHGTLRGEHVRELRVAADGITLPGGGPEETVDVTVSPRGDGQLDRLLGDETGRLPVSSGMRQATCPSPRDDTVDPTVSSDDAGTLLALREGVPLVGAKANSVLVLTQAGLDGVIMKSDLPIGVRLRRWLRQEVFPALKGRGHYAMPGAEIDDSSLDRLRLENERDRLALERARVQLELERLRLEGPAAGPAAGANLPFVDLADLGRYGSRRNGGESGLTPLAVLVLGLMRRDASQVEGSRQVSAPLGQWGAELQVSTRHLRRLIRQLEIARYVRYIGQARLTRHNVWRLLDPEEVKRPPEV